MNERPNVIRAGIAFLVVGLLFATSIPVLAELSSPGELLDAALTLGYSEGDVAGSIAHMEAALRQAPEDAEIRAHLARAMVTIGDVAGAHQHADQAIDLAGNSGNALFAKSQAVLLSGDQDAALDLALDTIGRDDIEYGPGTRGGLTLSAVALLMKRGDYLAAEQVLLKDDPALAELADQELPGSVDEIGGSWHRIQALAAIYVSTGRVSEGQRLSLRLAPITEDFLRSQSDARLNGPSLWNLAATGAGRIADDDAIEYLERAVEEGFVLGWRYNYAQHPTLWFLRDNPRFEALLDRLEREMTRQREQIITD